MANASIYAYSTTDVAEKLGVNRGTIVSWINRGFLKARNVGDGTIRPRWEIDEPGLAFALAHKDDLKLNAAKNKRKLRKQAVEASCDDAEVATSSEASASDVQDTSDLEVQNASVADKYIQELLEENRQLRKQIDALRTKHNKLVEDLLEVLVSNEN